MNMQELKRFLKDRHSANPAERIRQNGRLNIYPLGHRAWPLLVKELDQHYDKEDLPWEPPFLECIFEDDEVLVEAMRKDGEARGAIALSPVLAEAIRLSSGRVPAIPDDLYQLKSLVLDINQYFNWKYPWFLLEEGAYLLMDVGRLPRLSARFYYSPGDWSAVGRMKRLKRLKANNLKIDDFGFLASLGNLEKLDLAGTNFSQDALLAKLQKLTQLNLAQTGFSDCAQLLRLPKLRQANLSGCPLRNTDALEQVAAQVIL